MKQNHAIVVGGTKGIGRGLVEFWSQEPSPISVISRQIPLSNASKPVHVQYFAADITQEPSIAEAVDAIVSAHGSVSRLVFSQRFRGTGHELLEQEFAVGVAGTQRMIDYMISKEYFASPAAIVVVSSVASHLIAAEQPLGYHVNKAATEQLVRYNAVQLAPRGIRVNAVAPNLVEKDENRDFYRQNPEQKRSLESCIPLGTLGTTRDVAQAIDFLSSDRAAHITGQTLIIDGGLTLQLQHGMAKPPAASPDSTPKRGPK